jgi:hypothetical protein
MKTKIFITIPCMKVCVNVTVTQMDVKLFIKYLINDKYLQHVITLCKQI